MESSIPPPPADLFQEPLKTHFAVQLKPHEQAIHVASAVMQAAKSEKILFKRLEVLDTITIGTTPYVRMRSEVVNPYPILDKLYAQARGVISSMAGGEYAARMPGGRIGKVSNMVMHAIPKLGQSQMYKGTKIKHWERQFEAA